METILFVLFQLIEYVAVMLRKKLDFLHGSYWRYKPLKSSTNCGCGHLCGNCIAHSQAGCIDDSNAQLQEQLLPK